VLSEVEESCLTRRATASRPCWDSAKSERPRSGRSRCAGALGLTSLLADREALKKEQKKEMFSPSEHYVQSQ
jgi:hypothetical protein